MKVKCKQCNRKIKLHNPRCNRDDCPITCELSETLSFSDWKKDDFNIIEEYECEYNEHKTTVVTYDNPWGDYGQYY